MAASMRTLSGDCAGGLEHALAAEKLAERVEDPIVGTAIRFQRAYILWNTGPLDAACRLFDELITLARQHGDLPGSYGGEPMLALLLQLRASLESSCGNVARAYALADEAVQIARERRLIESEGWACSSVSNMEWIDGDVDRALPRCRRSLEIAEQTGSAFSMAWALDNLAGVLAHAGHGDALEMAERSVAISRERSTSLEGEAGHLAVLAEACIVAGDTARASADAAEALEVAERRGTWHLAPRVALAHARALRAAGGMRNAEQIRAALERTEELARRVGAVNYIPLATLERTALAELEGDAAAREAHLRTALSAFERIGAAFRVEQIRRMLGEGS
jgi:ATP/maltotriose-dependent transcriptional regulator MalT